MKNFRYIIIQFTVYFHVLLFTYAAISKLLDFENFQIQLAQSPLLSAYAGIISHSVIFIELIIAVLLCIPRIRLLGLYSSLLLMMGFSIYIYLILNFSDFVPCSCGGILEKLGWHEHLIFNLICVLILLLSIFIIEKSKEIRLKRTLLFTLLTMVLSSITIYSLFLQSEFIIKKENNFTRRMIINPIDENQSITLKNNSYYFAGVHQSELYLGNREYPLQLLKIKPDFLASENLIIRLDNYKTQYKSLRLQIKYPNFYVYDGRVPIILRGDLKNLFAKTISLDKAYYSQITIVEYPNFAIRTLNSKNKELVLGNLNINDSKEPHLYPNILQKQVDGFFDCDGILLFDESTKKLIYLYYYRNQFIVMDKFMDVLHQFNTIDTYRTAQIKTQKLSTGFHKMSAPPTKVNRNAFAFKNLLFVHSNLIGKHESRQEWKNSSVIDVYKTNEKRYIGSFYIPKKENFSVSDFMVNDHYLYVIMNHQLIKYQLTKSITKYFVSGEAENLSLE